MGAMLLRLWESIFLSHRIPDKIEISIEFLYQILVSLLDQRLLLLAGLLAPHIRVQYRLLHPLLSVLEQSLGVLVYLGYSRNRLLHCCELLHWAPFSPQSVLVRAHISGWLEPVIA